MCTLTNCPRLPRITNYSLSREQPLLRAKYFVGGPVLHKQPAQPYALGCQSLGCKKLPRGLWHASTGSRPGSEHHDKGRKEQESQGQHPQHPSQTHLRQALLAAVVHWRPPRALALLACIQLAAALFSLAAPRAAFHAAAGECRAEAIRGGPMRLSGLLLALPHECGACTIRCKYSISLQHSSGASSYGKYYH